MIFFLRTIKIGIAFLFLSTFVMGQSLENIRVNQIGYHPAIEKIALVIDNDATYFDLITHDGVVKYSGALKKNGKWYASGERVSVADFSGFQETGVFKIRLPDGTISHPFSIENHIYEDITKASVKYFYYNRSSIEVTEEFGKKWSRDFGHPDDRINVHWTAASEGLPKGTIISSPGGWYDAGDYNKYLATAGISTYSMLLAFEQYKDYISTIDLNIPESKNAIPDLLDECLWELRWMLTMQDPTDGGVFHKLSAQNFTGMTQPNQENNIERFVCGRNTNATLDFASTMAVSYRIFKKYDAVLPGFADSCLVAAKKAMSWATLHPDVSAVQCQEFNTGAYGDGKISDEWTWAPVEMYIATKDDSYLELAQFNLDTIDEANWADKTALPYLSILTHKEAFKGKKAWLIRAQNKVKQLANSYVSYRTKKCPYKVAMGEDANDWVWGSNGVAMNQSLVLLTAYHYFGKNEYLQTGLSNLHYVLGLNPTGYCYITGYGDKQYYFPHHRLSESDEVSNPIPGMLSGGPWATGMSDCKGYPSEYPAKKFLDQLCSYSTNEVAINWNAPLVYTLLVTQAILSKK